MPVLPLIVMSLLEVVINICVIIIFSLIFPKNAPKTCKTLLTELLRCKMCNNQYNFEFSEHYLHIPKSYRNRYLNTQTSKLSIVPR